MAFNIKITPETYPLRGRPRPLIFEDNSDQDYIDKSQDEKVRSVAIHSLSTPINSQHSIKKLISKKRANSLQSEDEVNVNKVLKKRHVEEPNDNNESEVENNNNNDEITTQLPLPSPSASPLHTASLSNDNYFENNFQLINPNSEAENLHLIENFSQNLFLNDKLLNTFIKSLPAKSNSTLLHKLLECQNRSVLSTLVSYISKHLKFDIISNLPIELSANIFSHLDYKSLINVSKVSKNWSALVNNNSSVWKNLLFKDNLIIDKTLIGREMLNIAKLTEKYYTVDEKYYSLKETDSLTKSVFIPNYYKLIYKKYYLINENWNSPTFQPKRMSLRAHGTNIITCLQFDDEKIVTGADDREVVVFDTVTGRSKMTLKGHRGGVWGLKYVGDTLVTAATDRTLRVWNLRTGKCTHSLEAHTQTVRCLDIIEPTVIGKDSNGEDIIYPKAPILVSGSRDFNLNIWDLSMVKDDEKMNKKYNLHYTEEEIKESLSDNIIELKQDSKYFLGSLRGHTSAVRAIAVHGKTIVSGSYDFTVRVWDAETKKCVHVLAGHSSKVYSVAIDPIHNRVYSGSLDSTVMIWDLTTGEFLQTLSDHSSLVGLIHVSPHYLATGAADTTVRIWNPEPDPVTKKITGVHVLSGQGGAITCLQHNDKRVISGSSSLMMWDIKTGEKVRHFLDDTSSVWQVSFNDKICVAAVQKNREEAWIEILDFEPRRV